MAQYINKDDLVKEIKQAVISGGDAGVELARDIRYKENGYK